MNRLPTLKQLQYLVALAETQHFGQAAEQCFVSQSTLSSSLLTLENLLDAKLVERNNKHVQLTPMGHTFVAQARLLLQQANDLVAISQQQKDFLTSSLRFGVIPTIAPFILPSFMALLRQQAPDLKLWLVENQTDELLKQLSAGQLDLLLMALPYDVPKMDVHILFDDEFQLIHAQHSRWLKDTSLKRIHRFEQLPQQSILLLGDGHCLRAHALKFCALEESTQVQDFSATSLLTLRQMVEEDLGMSFMPNIALQAGILNGTHVQVSSLNLPKVSRQIGLVWRKTSPFAQNYVKMGQWIAAGLTLTG